MNLPDGLRQTVEAQGCAIIESVLSDQDIARLRKQVESAIQSQSTQEAVRDRGGVYAIRNLTEVVPEVRDLRKHPNVARLVAAALNEDALLVRGLFFDKTADSNWGVFWHQDLSIAVKRKERVDGFGPWSVKAGVQHVQPPASILNRMLTVRLHLDECAEVNGALRVIPGSHRDERLTERESLQLQEHSAPLVCEVGIGGAVVMKPLLLHSSFKATEENRRRVLHLEFADVALPQPLEWYHNDPIELTAQ